jgi:hypothetical protein
LQSSGQLPNSHVGGLDFASSLLATKLPTVLTVWHISHSWTHSAGSSIADMGQCLVIARISCLPSRSS